MHKNFVVFCPYEGQVLIPLKLVFEDQDHGHYVELKPKNPSIRPPRKYDQAAIHHSRQI